MTDHLNFLTAKQVRAARALLAWSQQELAKAAGVASSTVADFERGARTPVPNNAEAMRAALEHAGVAFPPGGAVVGPPFPALASVSKSGAPIRWVNATDISQWAERRDGQGSLPMLLAKLARATGVVSAHFPSDEGVQFSGWDGITRAQTASEYVPTGSAGWEIGTQRNDIAGKANEDYDKRTRQPLELVPSESTFIFVTPRHWPAKEEWVDQKRAQGIWNDVRAYDGTDLVHWLELFPAVGQWLATYLGKRPVGAQQLEEVWLEWSLVAKVQLTPDLILSDRDKDAIDVLRWLRSEPTTLALQAESAEEIASFVYVAITQLPADAAEHYLARALVAATTDIARLLADSFTPLIIILLDPEPGLAKLIASKGHHVLLAYGGNLGIPGDVQKLERPSREGIEAALKAAGLPEEEAQRLARESSRSLAILRRTTSPQPGRLPAWAQKTPPRALLAALMAGAWDESSEADKAVMARVAETTYDSFAGEIVPFVGQFDSPLRKVGPAWKLASPRDAWALLAPYLSSADADRFEAVCIDVLGAPDPRYAMSPDKRWYAPIHGIKPEYSEFLRKGLGEILIMLSLFGERAHAIPDPGRRAYDIVQRLLSDADNERWWSLSRDFRLLAEAAPEAFLDAVDQSLDQNEPAIAALFESDDSPMFGMEHLSHLLWALESLAWAPQYLGRVSAVLARLDAIDPGGRYTNRPKNSLRHIFVFWSPQTSATLDARLRVLDSLRKRYPEQAWKLMLGILPSAHDTLTPAATTRWRDFTPEVVETATYALAVKGATEISDRLLVDVGEDVDRWASLVDKLTNLPDRLAAIEKLSGTVPRMGDRDRTILWRGLRQLLHHHRLVPDADWVLPKSELAEIERLYDALSPADPIARVSWLFDRSVALPHPAENWQENDEQLRLRRRDVAVDLAKNHGIDAVFAVASTLEDASILGTALVDGQMESDFRDLLLERSLKSTNEPDQRLAHGVIASMFYIEKEPWVAKMMARARDGEWGNHSFLTILQAVPSEQWSWDLARDAGDSIEDAYWKRAQVHWVRIEGACAEFVAEKLIGVGRARHAVHLVGQLTKKHEVSSELLVRVLLEAVRQPWDKNGNEPAMFQHYVTEVLKYLDGADDVSADTMLGLEWAYLPLLEYSGRPVKHLTRALAEKPDLFVQMVCAIFKPSDESGIIEDPPEDMERAKAFATQAYDLLHLWNVVPGTRPDGSIDGAALEAWVKEARKLAKAAGRDEIADHKIGEALSAAPIGDDGIWPALPVREVIEIVRSGHLETGLLIGQRNRRGVTTRLPRDGGAQEHDLAKRFREYSKATAFEWHRTSAVLDKISKGYDDDARRHDEDAERRDW